MKISAGRRETHVRGLHHGTRQGKEEMEKFETESAAILSLSERKVCRLDVSESARRRDADAGRASERTQAGAGKMQGRFNRGGR